MGVSRQEGTVHTGTGYMRICRRLGMDEQMENLKGKTITGVLEFQTEIERGYILVLDDEVYLTALDGEYGEDAFQFVTLDEVKEYLIKTPIYREQLRKATIQQRKGYIKRYS